MKMQLHSNNHLSTDISNTTPSTQSSQSSILCDYEIQQTIGSGNFGKVKLGIYRPTNKKVAIKILSKEKIKKRNEMRIVKRELDILPSFNHVNVIHFSKCIEDSSYIYIIMDYCELGELFDYIVSKTKLSEDETAFFFYQIINGVDYIHSKGVSHRDLKPENLLLTKTKLLKIVDFGLASTSNNQNVLGTRCGSPSYASPELLRGKKYNGYKTDVWSCGIILYAMICGYLPFDGKNNDELFKLIIKGNVEYPAGMSDVVKRILKRMLVVNPEHRVTIKEIQSDNLYLKGKKFFEQQFGFDPRNNTESKGNNSMKANNLNSSGNSLYGLLNMNLQEINTFRKKTNILGDNSNSNGKEKDGNFKVIKNIKVNNAQKQKTPILMVHLQTEPNESNDNNNDDNDNFNEVEYKLKITPLNHLYENKDSNSKRRDNSIKTNFFLLHQNCDTKTNTNNYIRGDSIKNGAKQSIGSHSKHRGNNNHIHLSLDHNITNPIREANRLFIGKGNAVDDLKQRNSLMSKFPFQNYINDASVKSHSNRRRIGNSIFNSITYEENQKRRIAMYHNEVLPKLISHH